MKITFIKSAVFANDFPKSKAVEIALAGRSNAGKSSFLNALSGQKIALVSQQPGKTRLLNFFSGPGKLRFVDMPGYGFAKRSASEIKQWGKMVESYLLESPYLEAIYLIMDVRRDWSEDEQSIADLVNKRNLKINLILTKTDKLNQKEMSRRKKEFKEIDSVDNIFFVSNKTRKGFELVLSSFGSLNCKQKEDGQ